MSSFSLFWSYSLEICWPTSVFECYYQSAPLRIHQYPYFLPETEYAYLCFAYNIVQCSLYICVCTSVYWRMYESRNGLSGAPICTWSHENDLYVPSSPISHYPYVHVYVARNDVMKMIFTVYIMICEYEQSNCCSSLIIYLKTLTER